MSAFYPSIDYVANGINRARDTKQSIISAVNSYEYIQKKIREFEEKTVKNIQNKKTEQVHFDPSEIEPIVFRDDIER